MVLELFKSSSAPTAGAVTAVLDTVLIRKVATLAGGVSSNTRNGPDAVAGDLLEDDESSISPISVSLAL